MKSKYLVTSFDCRWTRRDNGCEFETFDEALAQAKRWLSKYQTYDFVILKAHTLVRKATPPIEIISLEEE